MTFLPFFLQHLALCNFMMVDRAKSEKAYAVNGGQGQPYSFGIHQANHVNRPTMLCWLSPAHFSLPVQSCAALSGPIN